MKPDKAEEVIGCDLSLHDVEQALKKIGVDYSEMTRKDFPKIYGHVDIVVASQNVSTALLIVNRLWIPKNVGKGIRLSIDYQEDEWSVYYTNYEFKDSKVIQSTNIVWSPGA